MMTEDEAKAEFLAAMYGLRRKLSAIQTNTPGDKSRWGWWNDMLHMQNRAVEIENFWET